MLFSNGIKIPHKLSKSNFLVVLKLTKLRVRVIFSKSFKKN